MSFRPIGHPPIPSSLASGDIVAIVTIHDSQAFKANRITRFRKTHINNEQKNEGCHVFLHQVHERPFYSFGRGNMRTAGSSNLDTRDVYFPGKSSGMKQFLMLPVWDSNVWRLQSTTTTVAKVNDVPIQAPPSPSRTTKNKDPLPHIIHLNQGAINRVLINGLRVDIWLLKTVRQVYLTKPCVAEPLVSHVQDAARRDEPWASKRHILSQDQVSANSFRVVERFTGELYTVKLYRQGPPHARELRDKEYLRLAKEETDVSVVRYLQSVEIDNIPGIITSTHEGFAPYALLQPDIKKQHPGLRFTIATKLLRRLFSALDFLHFNGIIHGQVSKESVLLQLKDWQLEGVLLVDYSSSTSFIKGAASQLEEMVEDGQAAMEVIEDCSDIWQLRKVPTKDAMSEAWMRQKTTTAKGQYECVYRVVTDYFERQGNSRTSEKSKKLLRLLEEKRNDWDICQNRQIYNATLREVGLCQKSKIEEMVKDWAEAHFEPKLGQQVFMILSLGHPWLDDLASKLSHKRWDVTPHEVCAKFKELAGDTEAPWETIQVEVTVIIKQKWVGFDDKCIIAWLAGCCEAYPEWRQALETEGVRHIQPSYGSVRRHDINKLREALSSYGTLPQPMESTLKYLTASKDGDRRNDLQIQEVHHIAYHAPSRLFNLTQLQRLASPEHFLSCVSDGNIRCDNFLEVRGEPTLQGCYAPLSLLPIFAQQFGLKIFQAPDSVPLFPTFDPSDFSQVPTGKIVLARNGLLAFASVTRSGDQFVFHAPKYPKDFETGGFLPTYFGDMKVLPKRPEGIYEYFRPDHWSKFRTAEETEDAGDLGKRKILEARGLLTHIANGSKSSNTSTDMDVDKAVLIKELKQRAQLRSQARLPTKRNTDAQSSNAKAPTAKRSRVSTLPTPPSPPPAGRHITMSFLDRAVENMERIAENANTLATRSFFSPTIPHIPNSSFFQRDGGVNTNLLSSPPRRPIDSNRSLTIPSGSFDLEDDWQQADKWLAQMKDSDDEEPELSGLFGFRFHHNDVDSGSDTEEEDIPEQFKGGKGKGAAKSSNSFMFDQLHSVTEAISQNTEKEKPTNQLTLPFMSFPNASTLAFRPRHPPPKNTTMSFNHGAGHHRRMTTSNFTNVTRAAQEQHIQPMPRILPLATSASTQSDGFPASSSVTAASASFPALPSEYATQMEGVKTATDTNSDTAIGGWVRDEMFAAPEDDEDMPDTDVESWGDEE